MTNQEVLELLARFENSAVHTMRLTNGSFSLELSKGPAVCGGVTDTAERSPAAGGPAGNVIESESATGVITSPLAGVFYEAPSPGAQPYAAVGDRVRAGQTVCLMEAMKMISEIPAPCDCIITAILKENGKLAAYGEPLFRYQPC